MAEAAPGEFRNSAAPGFRAANGSSWLLLVVSVVINYVDRSNLSLAVPMLEQQFSISSLQAGELLVGIFLDLRSGAAVWAGGLAGRPFSRGLGALARLPAVVDWPRHSRG